MNWSELFRDTKGRLPYERSSLVVNKLQPYLAVVKEKYAEVAKDFTQSFREFGMETMGSATEPSEQRVSREAEMAKDKRRAALVMEDTHERSRPVPRAGSEREDTILIQYQIQVNQLDGEVAIPQGTKEEEMRRLILEDCAFHLTTKRKEAGEGRKSDALTGFNSFASLFSRF
jgi:uncharacterized protein (DUF2461 family)